MFLEEFNPQIRKHNPEMYIKNKTLTYWHMMIFFICITNKSVGHEEASQELGF